MGRQQDTIAALATASGLGAIGVIRVSGSKVETIVESLAGTVPEPRRASLRTLTDGHGEAFDQAIVIYYPAPGSYTGESLVEFQTHGGEAPLQRTLSACLASGARLADPGEFSERAFLNGKIDLLQAEAIADLIASRTSQAARSAYRSLSGAFSREVHSLAQTIRQTRTELEAYIDFPDEDIPHDVTARLAATISGVQSEISNILERARAGARLGRGLDIAILGRPNVGKSTLLNRLAREDRAITSPQPGTTRDVLTVDSVHRGIEFRFHDTAGLRERSEDLIEIEGMRRAENAAAAADVVLLISDDDTFSPEVAVGADIRWIKVRNKCDLVATEQRSQPVVYVSAKTGEGIDALLSRVIEEAGLVDADSNAIAARQRHLEGLNEARESLSIDAGDLRAGSPELVAEQLRLAQRALGRLVGEYTSEDLLGDIFSSFCIGK